MKPFIDRKYRTRREAEFTGLGGSSLGGLATLVLGLWFPNYFSRLAVMSPSIWWDDCEVYEIVEALDETAKPALKIWLDTGTHEAGWQRAGNCAIAWSKKDGGSTMICSSSKPKAPITARARGRRESIRCCVFCFRHRHRRRPAETATILQRARRLVRC